MRRTIWHVLRIGITLVLFILLFRPDWLGIHHIFIPVNLGQLWQEIRRLSLRILLPWMGLALLIKAVGMGFTVLRWHILLIGQGIRLPGRHLITAFLEGRFIGNML